MSYPKMKAVKITEKKIDNNFGLNIFCNVRLNDCTKTLSTFHRIETEDYLYVVDTETECDLLSIAKDPAGVSEIIEIPENTCLIEVMNWFNLADEVAEGKKVKVWYTEY